MLDIPALFEQYHIEPRGVIHVGAHLGEEVEMYVRMGFKRILLLESNPALFEQLRARVCHYPGVIIAGATIADIDGVSKFFAASNDQCGSILEMKDHRLLYPGIVPTEESTVTISKLDTVMRQMKEQGGVKPSEFNYLHMDIQGAELMALRGATETMQHIEAVSSEVNFREMYAGCARAEEIDRELKGFESIETAVSGDGGWGDRFYVRHPALNLWQLPEQGRFGNQLFQYAFARLFAQRHRLKLHTGEWPGRMLFGLDDPMPGKELPAAVDNDPRLDYSGAARAMGLDATRVANICAQGIFQFHTKFYAPHRDAIRAMFQPAKELRVKLDVGLAQMMGEKHRTLVAVHLRRGDYTQYINHPMFFLTPVEAYKAWLRGIWDTLDAPLLYVASDEGTMASEFSDEFPVANASHLSNVEGAEFYSDFYALSRADVLGISNSTFSFFAAMLNSTARAMVRPDEAGNFTDFDPWDAEPLLGREKEFERLKPLPDATILNVREYQGLRSVHAQTPEALANKLRVCREENAWPDWKALFEAFPETGKVRALIADALPLAQWPQSLLDIGLEVGCRADGHFVQQTPRERVTFEGAIELVKHVTKAA